MKVYSDNFIGLPVPDRVGQFITLEDKKFSSLVYGILEYVKNDFAFYLDGTDEQRKRIYEVCRKVIKNCEEKILFAYNESTTDTGRLEIILCASANIKEIFKDEIYNKINWHNKKQLEDIKHPHSKSDI